MNEYFSIITSLLEEYWNAVIVFTSVLFAFYLFKTLLIARLKALSKKTKTDIDDFAIDVLKTFQIIFATTLALIMALYATGVQVLSLKWVVVLTIAVITFQITKSTNVIFLYATRKTIGRENAEASVYGLKSVIYIVIWLIGGLTIVGSLGFDITSIIAGLGIGGIAVALAVQNVLGDVLSSFSLYFDKPFTVGDYILIGTHEGTVERIGLKSTRIRSLRGEMIVMSNRQLTEDVVQNFGLIQTRRVVTELGFAYQTNNKKLAKIPEAIKKIIEQQGGIQFERVYFKEFGDSALIYELSYYIDSPDFEVFTQKKHAVNLSIKAWVEKEGIDIAYPTQHVYINKV